MMTGDTMLYVDGSKAAFRCECGANVFKKIGETDYVVKYTCNGCGARYEGNREASDREAEAR
jgi:hypothetical protein